MRILLVEPDCSLAGFLKRKFEAEKFAVDVAGNIEEINSYAQKSAYAAAILDVEFLGLEGFDILRQLRAGPGHLPIQIIAGTAQAGLRNDALNVGASDFVVKPLAFPELAARLRNLIESGGNQVDRVMSIKDLELSRANRVVKRAGREIRLTPKEFALLEYLLANAGQRVTRSEIVQHVWNYDGELLTNIVDVYVNYLRKKVDVPFEPKLIHTVRGVGYKLEPRASVGHRVA